MIPEEEIKRECSQQTYLRAQQIASRRSSFRSAVVSFNDSRGVRTTELSAGVLSSDKKRYYKATILADEAVGELLDYACTCPAAYEYSGMCKHSAALAMHYNQSPQSFMGYVAKKHTRTSSEELLALMERESAQTLNEPTGKIELIPTLRYYFGNWDLSFKVAGNGTSYVLKSIDDFIDRMHNGAFYSYGKKLSFTHKPERLDKRSLSLFRFVERACEQRGSLSLTGSSLYSLDYGFGNRRGNRQRTARDLSLTDIEVVELFELLEGQTLFVQNDETGSRGIDWADVSSNANGPYEASVVRADPDLSVDIRKTESGFGITPPYDSVFVSSGDSLCIWRGRTIYLCSPEMARISDLLRTLHDSEGLFLSQEDAPLFCSTVLPLMEKALPLQIPDELAKMKPIPCQIKFYLDANKKRITCEAYAEYGEESFPLTLIGPQGGDSAAIHAASMKAAKTESGRIVRDNVREANAARIAGEFVPGGEIDLHNPDMVGPLLFGGLVKMKEVGQVYTTAAFDRLIFDKRPSISTGLSMAGNLIQLNLTSDELEPEEVASLIASYRERKHYHKLKNGAFLNITEMDQAQLEKIEQALSSLDIPAKDLRKASVDLPAYDVFFLDELFDHAIKDEQVSRYIDNFRKARGKEREIPQSLKGTLRPYQKEGFSWLSLLSDCGFGGILADEMGLGKSIQLISWILAQKETDPGFSTCLIVCPASLIYNWTAELTKFAPSLNVKPIDGQKYLRSRTRAEAPSTDVFVASYDILRIDAKEFAEMSFYACVLDEAQYIKNRSTKSARAVKKLNTKHRFALTGTPIENKPSELWSIFDFLLPGLLGSPMRFRENFEIPILGNDDEAVHRLRKLVGPFILRRTKKEVLTDLPEKTESTVYAVLEGEQKRLYAAREQHLRDRLNMQKKKSAGRGGTGFAPANEEVARKRAATLKSKRPVIRETGLDVVDPTDMSKVEVLAEITRLRQLCLNPSLVFDNYHAGAAKLPVIMDLVQQGIDAGLKMLVFSQFTTYLSQIGTALEDAGIKHFTLTGQTSAKKRLEMVDAFNKDDTPVFLISMKAGGTGLNLTGASFVILTDPWWNAAVQEQASDRAHRIGQTRKVNVVKVVAKDTIEERIVALQESKRELASSLIEGNSGQLASLTTDELIDLFM